MTKIVALSLNIKKSGISLITILNNLMGKRGLNMAQLSKNTGLAFTTIKRLCTDPTCNPTMASLEKISTFFLITPAQLMGTEPMADESNGYRPNFSTWENIPIITLQQLIVWPNNIEEIRTAKSTQFVKTDLEINESVFALKAMDESLEPKFSPGTTLIFDHTKQYKNKDYVVLLINGKELPQIRQIFIDGPDVYIKAINPAFSGNQPTKIEKNIFTVLGVLIQAKFNFL